MTAYTIVNQARTVATRADGPPNGPRLTPAKMAFAMTTGMTHATAAAMRPDDAGSRSFRLPASTHQEGTQHECRVEGGDRTAQLPST